MKYAELKNKGRKPPVKNDKQAERVSEEVHLNFQGVVPYLKSERKDCDPPLKQKKFLCMPASQSSPLLFSLSPPTPQTYNARKIRRDTQHYATCSMCLPWASPFSVYNPLLPWHRSPSYKVVCVQRPDLGTLPLVVVGTQSVSNAV